MPPETPPALLIAGPDASARLGPLIAAHRRHRPVRVVTSLDLAQAGLGEAGGVLVAGGIEPPAGMFLRAPSGRPVPVGWLPDLGTALPVWVEAAAALAWRAGAPAGPVVFLAELEERAHRAVAAARGRLGGVPAFDWSAQRLRRTDLLAALRCGPGAVFYFGHAAAGGWRGYGGIEATHLAAASGAPIGAVLSLSCSAAAAPAPGRPSFAQSLLSAGLAGAVLGADGPTLHDRNVALGSALAQAIGDGAATLGEALCHSAVTPGLLDGYRLLGDPLAPLAGAPEALTAAARVFAPAPEETLPVVALTAWGGAPGHHPHGAA